MSDVDSNVKGTKRTGSAWAVVDVSRRDRLSTYDLAETKERAQRLREARAGVRFPIHEGAIWKVVRVRIEQV